MSSRLNIFLIMAFLFVSTTRTSWAGEEEWGAYFPLPSGVQSPVYVFNMYKNPSGEIIIPYYFDKENNKFIGFYNFTKSKIEQQCQVSEDTSQCHVNIIPGLTKIERVNYLNSNNAPTGNPFDFKAVGGGNCTPPVSLGIQAIYKEKIVEDVMILWLTKEKHAYKTAPICNMSDGKDTLYIHAESLLFMALYKFDDNTILGHAFDKPIAIRFRQDLSSPYLSLSNGLLKIRRKKALDIYNKCIAEALSSDLANNELSTAEVADECFYNIIIKEVSE